MADPLDTRPLRIVIADDNYLVREGTRRLLEDSGEVTVQAAVGSAAELLDAVGRLRPDSVLTDIRMPAGPGGGADGGPGPGAAAEPGAWPGPVAWPVPARAAEGSDG